MEALSSKLILEGYCVLEALDAKDQVERMLRAAEVGEGGGRGSWGRLRIHLTMESLKVKQAIKYTFYNWAEHES